MSAKDTGRRGERGMSLHMRRNKKWLFYCLCNPSVPVPRLEEPFTKCFSSVRPRNGKSANNY